MLAHFGIIAAYYLLIRCFAAGFVVYYAAARHVHTHVGWGFIGAFAVYLLKYRRKHGEYFNVPVVIHGRFAVCFQVERVYHVHVVKVSRRRLIRNVYRVLQRQVPYRERFKFSIASPYAALMLMIKLAQAHRHLSAARSRRGNNYQRPAGFYVFVLAVAFGADYQLHVARIALYRIMPVYADAQPFKPLPERIGNALPAVLREHHAANIKPYRAECVNKP